LILVLAELLNTLVDCGRDLRQLSKDELVSGEHLSQAPVFSRYLLRLLCNQSSQAAAHVQRLVQAHTKRPQLDLRVAVPVPFSVKFSVPVHRSLVQEASGTCDSDMQSLQDIIEELKHLSAILAGTPG
jgi:hypothetical protein